MLWQKLIWLPILLFSLLGLAIPAKDGAQKHKDPLPAGAKVVPGEWIAVLENNMNSEAFEAAASSLENLLGTNDEVLNKFNFGSFRAIAFRSGLGESALSLIRSLPGVEVLEPNPVVRVDQGFGKRNTTQYVSVNYNLDRISHRTRTPRRPFSYIYNELAGGSIYIYVLDTGIHTPHDEFQNNFGPRAFHLANFVQGEKNGDFNGHGTNVAGIAGGKTYGVAKSSLIFDVKVLDYKGDSSGRSTLQGMEFTYNDAVNNNRVSDSVVNLSLGTNQTISEALDRGTQALVDGGLFTAVAAGNNYVNADTTSPARVIDACTIGATNDHDIQAHFSNYGLGVDIWAPGVDIEAASPRGTYETAPSSGTSQATPHVAGVAALYKAYSDRFRRFSPTTLCRAMLVASTQGEILFTKGSNNNNLLFDDPAAYLL